MAKSRKNTLIIIFVFFVLNSFAQKDTIINNNGFTYVGFMAGALFPNQTTAVYYNGGGNNGLFSLFTTYPSLKQEVVDVLGYDFLIPNQIPDIRYRIPFYYGFNFGVNSPYFGDFILENKYTELELITPYQIQVLNFNTGLLSNSFQAILYGKEKRGEINLGYQKGFDYTNLLSFYAEIFINGNIVQATSNDLIIETPEREISFNIFSPTNNYNPSKTALGFGIIGGAGFRYLLGAKFIFTSSVRINYTQVNLMYKKSFQPSLSLVSKLLLKI